MSDDADRSPGRRRRVRDQAEVLPAGDDAVATIARAVTAFLQRPTAATRRALVATGAAGLNLVLEWWFGPATADRPVVHDVPDRAVGDRWREAIALLAVTCPAAFMDAVTDHDRQRHLVDVLGGVDDARAVDALARLATDDDWLTRHGAMCALSRHAGEPATSVLRAGLVDAEPVVRAAAIEALAGREPERALAAARALLADPALTPLLAQELRRLVRRLTRGAARGVTGA